MKVQKLEGGKEKFDPKKIFWGVFKSAQEAGEADQLLAKKLAQEVVEGVKAKYPNGQAIPTAFIGELVEGVLIKRGQTKIAKAYISYRENKKHVRQDKASLGIKDDLGLSYNSLYILKTRYLKKNDRGEVVESPRDMMARVAKVLSEVEETDQKRQVWNDRFMTVMSGLEFLPGSRTLANAGKRFPQLANCFVWPMEDDIDDIFEILHQSTLIKKYGGGCGYNFSKVRPEGDSVAGTPGLAAGPVKMIEMFDLMTSLFRQEGRYESGNMAILNVSHPDIFNFISSKKADGYLSKTNLSVGITDDFMRAAISGREWKLVSPRTGEVVNKINAKSILELMAQMAWATGDPGMINLSAMNRGTALANPLLKKKGPITATNVCGEIPLYPFESCNLGYLNLTKFAVKGKFDFSRLREVVSVAVRMLDNVIEASWFPVKEVSDSVRAHRRIGIGAVGWAETLIALGCPYDSSRALTLAEKIVKAMYQSAFQASVKLAWEKGSFSLVRDSIWANKKNKPRNVALLTFPPSSANAVICDTSYGIEPLFALAYEQNVLDGVRLKSLNPLFVAELKGRGLYSDKLIQAVIDNHGSARGVKGIPKEVQELFKVAHDISWRDHIKIQAAFQKWTDNAITKTINMPASATPQDIEEAFVLAWKLGCKGLTVYRDKAKDHQVFDFGGKENKIARYCPNCDIKLTRDGKCYKCKKCRFSTCDI